MRGLVKGIPSNMQSNLSGSITNYSIDVGVKGRIIPLMFSPEGLSDSVQASYNQTPIAGSSAPQITYSSTGARTVSFSLTLPLDYLPPNSDYSNFEDYLNAFRALVYPKYSAGGKVESPHCKLVTSNLELDGVCQQCAIEYRTDRYANDGSMSANVSLSFMEVLGNTADVDAKWIANSKVNVLNGTLMTTGNSYSSITNSSSSLNNTSKCYVTLRGQQNNLVKSTSLNLTDVINNNIWTDPGFAYSNKDKYAVKKYYGYTLADFATVSNLSVTKSGLVSCRVNGSMQELKYAPFNINSLGSTVVTYFIVYVPLSNGNNYEVETSKIRYITIQKVSG